MIKALMALLSKTHMNLLKPGKGLEEQSPVIPRIELYLHQKDESFLDYLSKLHLQNSDSDNPEWKNFFNTHLLKGLNGLLPYDTCLFIWDQGYIMSFHKTLSIVLSSLLLSFKDVITEPVEQWPNSKTAFNTFCTYCSTISVTELQKILSHNFAVELGEEFVTGRGYTLEDDDGILMAVYKKAAVENIIDENTKPEAVEMKDDLDTKSEVHIANIQGDTATTDDESDEQKSKKSHSSD
jgi:hypothetical protein